MLKKLSFLMIGFALIASPVVKADDHNQPAAKAEKSAVAKADAKEMKCEKCKEKKGCKDCKDGEAKCKTCGHDKEHCTCKKKKCDKCEHDKHEHGGEAKKGEEKHE